MVNVELKGKNFNYLDEGGSGDPVIHICGLEWSYDSTAFASAPIDIPRLDKSEDLIKTHRVISYNRYGPKPAVPLGGPIGRPFTHPNVRGQVVEATEDCLALMQYLDIAKAHIFAHSQVTVIGLDLAMREPEKVATIAIHEPEMTTPSWVAGKFFGKIQQWLQSPEAQAKLQAKVQSPEMQAKIQNVMWSPEYQAMLQKRQVESQHQATGGDQSGMSPLEANADTGLLGQASKETDPAKFQMQMHLMPLLGDSLDVVSQRIKQPILSILTSYSSNNARRSDELLKSLLPQTEAYLAPKPSHWYKGMEDMKDIGAGYMAFLSRHPI